MAITDTELLHHALVGFEARRAEIDKQIDEVRRALNGTAVVGPRPKRVLSPEARARIAVGSAAPLGARWEVGRVRAGLLNFRVARYSGAIRGGCANTPSDSALRP